MSREDERSDPKATDRGRLNTEPPEPGLVLILDDHEIVTTAESRLVAHMGATPHVEHTEDGALSFVASHDVSAMLVDVNLGRGGNGLDFLQRARDDVECDAAALVFSGMSRGDLMIPPNRLGARFVPKDGSIGEKIRFYRMARLWPAYRRTLERIVQHFETHEDEEYRLSTSHIRLVRQFVFFGRDGLRERLGLSDATRKRQQRRLFNALCMQQLGDIWEVLGLLDGVAEGDWVYLLGRRRAGRRGSVK